MVINFGKKKFPNQKLVIDHFINDALKNYNNYSIAYVVRKDTNRLEIENYIKSFSSINKSLIHGFEFGDKSYFKSLSNIQYHFFLTDYVDMNYIDEISNNNAILVKDGFVKQTRNVDYPSKNRFQSNLTDYASLNAIGFGDFTIIGNNDTTGFAAFSVALHLTVINGSSIYIYHFVSDDKDGQSEIARKYNDALTELVGFVDKNGIFITTGIEGFQGSYKEAHYPGLGIPKKWSIKNHIEQITNIL